MRFTYKKGAWEMVEMALACAALIIMVLGAACFLYCFWYVIINEKGEDGNDERNNENDYI